MVLTEENQVFIYNFNKKELFQVENPRNFWMVYEKVIHAHLSAFVSSIFGVQQTNSGNFPLGNAVNYPNKEIMGDYCDVMVTSHEKAVRLWALTLTGLQLVNSVEISGESPVYCCYLPEEQLVVVLLASKVLQIYKLDNKENKLVFQVEKNIINLKYANKRCLGVFLLCVTVF